MLRHGRTSTSIGAVWDLRNAKTQTDDERRMISTRRIKKKHCNLVLITVAQITVGQIIGGCFSVRFLALFSVSEFHIAMLV